MNNTVRKFGRQSVWVEDPDLLRVRLEGTVDAASLEQLLSWQCDWSQGKDYYFVLCDISKVASLPPETRRMFQRFKGGACATIAACHGAGFTVRVLIDMMVRARRLLLGQPSESEVRCFATEAQARAFIEKERRAWAHRRRRSYSTPQAAQAEATAVTSEPCDP